MKSQAGHERVQQKSRTRSQLLSAARDLLAAGRQPSLQEIADQAGISRATAYRYYSNVDVMLHEAVLDGIAARIGSLDIAREDQEDTRLESRLDGAVIRILDMVFENEALFRTYLKSVLVGGERETRGARRIRWITDALGKDKKTFSKQTADRLTQALSLLTGIETVIVLRDVCGLEEEKARELCRWTCKAILAQALRDAEAG